MSMNFYIEMLSRCYREGKIKTKKFRDHNDVRSRFPPFFLSFFSTCKYLLEEKKIIIIKDTKAT